MRLVIKLLGLLASLIAWPAAAEWTPSEPLSFVQGSTNNILDFQVPVLPGGIGAFEGMDLTLTYDASVIAPTALSRIITSNDTYFDFVSSLPTSPASGGSPVGTEILFVFDDLQSPFPPQNCTVCSVHLTLLADPSTSGSPIDGPGVLLHTRLRFDVLPQALGPSTVTATYAIGESDPIASSVHPTIVAVPEPAAWATMIAGLALVGFAAGRRRRIQS